jgi:hypothetical protein
VSFPRRPARSIGRPGAMSTCFRNERGVVAWPSWPCSGEANPLFYRMHGRPAASTPTPHPAVAGFWNPDLCQTPDTRRPPVPRTWQRPGCGMGSVSRGGMRLKSMEGRSPLRPWRHGGAAPSLLRASGSSRSPPSRKPCRHPCLSNAGFGLNPKTHKGVLFRCRCRLRCRNREMSSLEYDYDRDNDDKGAVGDTHDSTQG